MKPLQLTKSMQSAKLNWRQILFAGLLTGSLFCSPVVTLFAGILFALTLGNPFPVWSKKASKKLLQYCVVGLGFGMNFHESLAAGREGMTFTVVSVVTVMIVGVVLGRLLRIDRKNSYLLSSGTAICGGSAIAATAPVIHASDEEVAQSISVIFLFNVLAALLFPALGQVLHLSNEGFGLFAGTAINDTSSVTAAAAAWDGMHASHTLESATIVKMTRTLAIIPITLVLALYRGKKEKNKKETIKKVTKKDSGKVENDGKEKKITKKVANKTSIDTEKVKTTTKKSATATATTTVNSGENVATKTTKVVKKTSETETTKKPVKKTVTKPASKK